MTRAALVVWGNHSIDCGLLRRSSQILPSLIFAGSLNIVGGFFCGGGLYFKSEIDGVTF